MYFTGGKDSDVTIIFLIYPDIFLNNLNFPQSGAYFTRS
jgi:hypothetical protein